MCLLLLLHRVHPEFPIVVAANRDERFDRPSLPPELSPDGSILAPRDARAGGTWIGVNRHGLFAGLTNRSAAPVDPALPSRGAICRTALSETSARSATARVVREWESRPSNGWNLLVADANEAAVVHREGARTETIALSPGLHVLTNEHDVDRLFVDEIAERFTALRAADRHGADSLLSTLAEIVRDHTVRTPENHSICKHFDGRGTVSSCVVLVPALGGGHGRGRFLFAPGPPCVTPFRDLSAAWPSGPGDRGE